MDEKEPNYHLLNRFYTVSYSGWLWQVSFL
jgi:hypothetical protein